jgi:polar amino acid transport system permease protein
MSENAPGSRPPPRVDTAWWRRWRVGEAVKLLLLTGALGWLVVRGAGSIGYNWQWFRVPRYLWRVVDGELIWGPLAKGLVVTLQVSGLALVFATAIGVATAIMRLVGTRGQRAVARAYLEIIRNTPLLMQIYVIYFVIAPVLGIDRYVTAVAALSVFGGAFVSEIVRAGIEAVPKGQWEAAAAVGLSRPQLYRLIVLPQALRLVLPPLTGQAITLIKASSIVSVIAIFDLTTEGRNIISDTFLTFEVWLTVAAIYLAVTLTISLAVGALERRLGEPATA